MHVISPKFKDVDSSRFYTAVDGLKMPCSSTLVTLGSDCEKMLRYKYTKVSRVVEEGVREKPEGEFVGKDLIWLLYEFVHAPVALCLCVGDFVTRL